MMTRVMCHGRLKVSAVTTSDATAAASASKSTQSSSAVAGESKQAASESEQAASESKQAANENEHAASESERVHGTTSSAPPQCSRCSQPGSYFDQEDLSAKERGDFGYYQGRGAPAPGVDFSWMKFFSDGAGCQFMCLAFLLLISGYHGALAIHVAWHWFCSCHGKVSEILINATCACMLIWRDFPAVRL